MTSEGTMSAYEWYGTEQYIHSHPQGTYSATGKKSRYNGVCRYVAKQFSVPLRTCWTCFRRVIFWWANKRTYRWSWCLNTKHEADKCKQEHELFSSCISNNTAAEGIPCRFLLSGTGTWTGRAAVASTVQAATQTTSTRNFSCWQ